MARALCAIAIAVFAACAEGEDDRPCTSVADCLLTETCFDGICRPKDAGGGTDAGGAADAGGATDAGPTDAASVDAAAPEDGGPDAGPPAADAGPSCSDGVQNGDETYIDCGGSCGACEECSSCGVDGDCVRGRCAGGLCALRQEIYVDWIAHCSTDGSAFLDVPGIPEGDYRVTALESAQTVWDAPWSPPMTGWFWRWACEDMPVTTLHTPSGARYATEAEAFAAIEATTETVAFGGGTIRCQILDSNCADNHGGSRFSIERVCP